MLNRRFNQTVIKKKWQEEQSDGNSEEVNDVEIPKESDDESHKSEVQQPIEEIVQDENEVNKDFIGWLHQEGQQPEQLEQPEQQDESQQNNNKLDWMDSDVSDVDVSSGEEYIDDKEQRTLFIQNIPTKMDDKSIREFFAQYGLVINIDVIRNEGSAYNKGRAFLEYSSEQEANKVFKMTLTMGQNKLQISKGMQTLQGNRSRSRSKSK